MKAVLKHRRLSFTKEMNIPHFLPVIRFAFPPEPTLGLIGDKGEPIPPPRLPIIEFQFVYQDQDGVCCYEEHEEGEGER